MADAQNRLRQQHVHASNALNYGHLGTATYLEQSASWAYLRRNIEAGAETVSIDPEDHFPPKAFPFAPVEDAAKIVIEADQPENQALDHDTNTNLFASHKNLLNCFPEIVPAITCLAREESSAFGIPDASHHIKHGCMAFGGAAVLVETGKVHRTIPIAAMTTGKNAESVRLAGMGKESVSLLDVDEIRRNYWLPTISAEEIGCWTGHGEEILQICFAASWQLDSIESSWMAVRQKSCTTLFHPLLHRLASSLPISQNGPSFVQYAPSRLDANPIIALPMSRTGGYGHSDVQFHPQDHRTLALIDECGNWSVWKLTGRQANSGRVNFRISLDKKGKLSSWKDITPSVKTPACLDDWHRICWLSCGADETDRILVCNHRAASVYSALSEKIEPVDLRFGLQDISQRLLDVKRSTVNPKHYYFLTSSRFLLMSATKEDRTDFTSLESLGLVLSWQHFRSKADLSLKMTLLETPRSTSILVSSDENAIVTAFRVGFVLDGLPTPISLADPAQIDLNLHADSHLSGPARILDFRGLEVQRQPQHPVHLSNPALFKLFLRRTNSGIEEVLYRSTERDISSTSDHLYSNTTAGPFLRGVNLHVQSVQWKSEKYVELESLSEFIVHDHIELEDDGDSVPRGDSRRVGTTTNLEGQQLETAREWENTSKLIEEERDSTALRPRTELEILLADIRQDLDQNPLEAMQILSNLTDAIPYVAEAEAGSESLRMFLKEGLSSLDLQIGVLGLHGYEQDILLNRYNQLSQHWLKSMPSSATDRQRVNRERLCRAIATDLALASVTVRSKPAEPRQEAQLLEDLQSLRFSSPSPSAITAASSPEDPAISRLRAYAPILKPIPPTSTSEALCSLLAHLPTDPNADPEEYDYRATEARISRDADQSKIDPKARRRAEREANQHRKRIEAQKQMSQALRERELGGGVPGVFSSQIMEQGSQMGMKASAQTPVADRVMAPGVTTPTGRNAFGPGPGLGGSGKKGKSKERQQGF